MLKKTGVLVARSPHNGDVPSGRTQDVRVGLLPACGFAERAFLNILPTRWVLGT